MKFPDLTQPLLRAGSAERLPSREATAPAAHGVTAPAAHGATAPAAHGATAPAAHGATAPAAHGAPPSLASSSASSVPGDRFDRLARRGSERIASEVGRPRVEDGAVTRAPNASMLESLYLGWGRLFLRPLITQRWVSQLPGRFMDSWWSRPLIAPFICAYGIDMKDYARPSPRSYDSFNDFFTRELAPGARPVDARPRSIASPADCSLLALPSADVDFPVKGQRFDLARFLGDRALAEAFAGGSLLVCRLTPADYHRFHFPLSGRASSPRRIGGRLHSVDPIVYRAGIVPLVENERHVIELDTPTFGKVVMVPVGALGVGKIVETYASGESLAKGAEAGFFKFGGSTVVLAFQRGRAEFEPALVEASERGEETRVRMGQPLGFVASRVRSLAQRSSAVGREHSVPSERGTAVMT